MAGKGSAPGERRGGRQKGTPNKNTALLREMILSALEEEGGVDYLRWASREQPAGFLTLLGKVLPTQLTGADDGPLVVEIVKFAHQAAE